MLNGIASLLALATLPSVAFGDVLDAPISDDGFARDLPFDGTFDTISTAAEISTLYDAVILFVEDRGIVEFDITSIPNGSMVQSATLYLYTSTVNFPGTPLHRLHTYAGNGIVDLGDAVVNNPLYDFNPSTTLDQENQLAIPPGVIQDLVDGGQSHAGFMLQMLPNFSLLAYRSSENSNPGLRPRLVITYAVPVGDAYCYGTGCPCGNDDSSGGCVSSAGQGALLSGFGSASAATDDLILSATLAPMNHFGIMFMGTSTRSLPFGDGKRCAGGFVIRFPIQNSGPSGTITEGPGIMGSTGLAAGDTRHFQCWFRDPVGPCGSGFNTSNGLTIVVTP